MKPKQCENTGCNRNVVPRKTVLMNRMKRNKYNAQSNVYNGDRYDSRLEASYAMQLDWMIKAGEVERWERQHKIDIRVNDQHICNYYIDFKVFFTGGHVEYWEVKGFATQLWQLKWNLVQAIHPDWKFVLKK